MFVQMLEGRTTDAAGLARQGERWQTEVRPSAVGFLGATSGVTEDEQAITIVRFESEDAARANSDRPEQGAWWAETEKYYEGDVRFTESSDVTELMGGGSDAAGFVQVMKVAGVDRALVERLDGSFEQLAALRPDLIGGLRVWTGPDRYTEAIYFTSEADARAGEQVEMPGELQAALADFEEIMARTEFLDLRDPQLH